MFFVVAVVAVVVLVIFSPFSVWLNWNGWLLLFWESNWKVGKQHHHRRSPLYSLHHLQLPAASESLSHIWYISFYFYCDVVFVLFCHQIYVLLIKNWRSTRFIIFFCIWEGGTTCTRLLLGTTNLDSFLYFFYKYDFQNYALFNF